MTSFLTDQGLQHADGHDIGHGDPMDRSANVP